MSGAHAAGMDMSLALHTHTNALPLPCPAQEAFAGQGAAGSFISLLEAQGLSPRLRDMVLYGVVMPHTAPTTPDTRTTHRAAPSSRDVTAAPRQLLTAAQGMAALLLYAQSVGRFGVPGAFMVPAYGCGSLAEALVRHCAVKGAVTALRQPVLGLVIGPHHAGAVSSQPQAQAAVTPDGPSQQGGSEAAVYYDRLNQGDGRGTADAAATGGEHLSEESSPVGNPAISPATEAVIRAGNGSQSVRGVVLASGQVLQCRQAVIMRQGACRCARACINYLV
jgi:hypothetical protein